MRWLSSLQYSATVSPALLIKQLRSGCFIKSNRDGAGWKLGVQSSQRVGVILFFIFIFLSHSLITACVLYHNQGLETRSKSAAFCLVSSSLSAVTHLWPPSRSWTSGGRRRACCPESCRSEWCGRPRWRVSSGRRSPASLGHLRDGGENQPDGAH